MKRLKASLFASALGLLLLAGAEAKAGIDWSYDWTPSSTVIWSDNSHSSLTMTNQSPNTAVGNSDIIATELAANSKTADATPDLFTHDNYTLKMKLTDTASGAFTTLTFTGDISGMVSAHSTNTTNVFHSPMSITGIHLGSNIYDVTIGPYTGPGPGGGLTGSIGAHVNVKPAGGNPNPSPEPTSLVLGCLGMSFAGLAAWRKRRNPGELIAA